MNINGSREDTGSSRGHGAGVQVVDVVVVGAGISGISTARYLRKHTSRTFLVLERRDEIGGTWSFMRYPGIRSDSDMFTFGYSWKPWKSDDIISPGSKIMAYLREAVQEEKLEAFIRFGENVVSASYNSRRSRWRLRTSAHNEYHCKFLIMNTGYFSYEKPHRPTFKDEHKFSGRIVHPQLWPDIDYANKKVVVIGSGATAATLVPALCKGRAKKVTMVQRSPTYFISRKRKAGVYRLMRQLLGDDFAYMMKRAQVIFTSMAFYKYCLWDPERARWFLMREAQKQLPSGFDTETHLNPAYNPWSQRLCLVPDGDLFAAVRDGSADIITGSIGRFTKDGLRVRPKVITGHGSERKEVYGEAIDIQADIIVTATGIEMQENFPVSTVHLDVDGLVYDAPHHFVYRGCMLSDVPNFFFTMGYANISWTLKADLVSKWVCDLLNHCEVEGVSQVCPRRETNAEVNHGNFFDLESSYLRRSASRLPKQGAKQPWRLDQDVIKDYWRYNIESFGGEELEFVRKTDSNMTEESGCDLHTSSSRSGRRIASRL